MNAKQLGRWGLLVVVALSLALGTMAAAPAEAAGGLAGTVDSTIGLNLRAGPGLSYRVILVLADKTQVELLGRSGDGQWLEARLPEGLGGWVFASYMDADGDVSRLPVTEAAGGPTDVPPAARGYSLYVIIADNEATVYVQKFPANAAVNVKLGPASSARDSVLVASGTTDANGSAQIKFPMPRTWANGQRVTERNLTLAAATADEAFSRSVSVLYVR
jgi:uncharacterized protein YraI